jgi:hypothetical protein
LARVVGTWATSIEPLNIESGEPVSWFPEPFKVIILPVRRTQPLYKALVAIRDAGARAGFPLATLVPPDQWTFHLTLATCSSLKASAWTEARRIASGCEVQGPAHSVVKAAELVVFDNDTESSGGSFPFGTRKA